jgi:glutathione S-transferase
MADAKARRYELYYWPTIQGRGEFIRLALEEAGADYIDVARLPDEQGGGEDNIESILEVRRRGPRPFALPAIKLGDTVLSQTGAILHWLGPRLNLAPPDEDGRAWALELALTVADLVTEAHDAHHPIASGLYYEEQREEARRRAADVVDNRIPRFLAHFEAALAENPDGSDHLIGDRLTYPDLSLFQLVAGLQYAFPRAMKRLSGKFPLCLALHHRVAARPRIAAYLASPRRIPFNEMGIFRHYDELDAGR